jgi:hypothetical protein
MLRRIRKKRAQSLVEYIALITFILAAFLVFQKYIARAFSGRWKTVGDSIGQGRIYDPVKTTECAYDFQFTNSWYNVTCFEQDCDCFSVRHTEDTNVPTLCEQCITACNTSRCND